MDVLAIILACSLHPDDELIRALVDVQSAGNVFFVGDLDTLKSRDSLTSIDEALRAVNDIRQHGGRPALGLLGVPLAWASRYGRTPADLFDPCTNIAIGTAALTEYHDRCAGKSPKFSHRRFDARRHGSPAISDSPSLRTCILSRLAADSGVKAVPSAVLKAISDRSSTVTSDPTDPPPQRSGIFTDSSLDGALAKDSTAFGDTGPVGDSTG